ncbi:hypothetical protein DSM32_23995 [Salmonella enterica subsp. enterica serovar Enteritidis]|uniref:Uncharacterized protein n=2 Tax=Salmonella enterica TaxID=28901 RepID=A0A5W7HSR6_SALEN|nr:hypothetical protein [Salmonella enterica]EBV1186976.1 hypothetical protein [Salmonella enterica subsp. enterica serovar Enteritidis]EEV5559157.1 hypothetical protein [Escherichia coli]PRV90937.1 hypothetical protein B1R85_02920 [Salmonella enterica subsp. enterica serovar Weltevreden]EBX5425506.1 hypothetical protein [Salmonella enterica subsp. enterica serovar Enteritidis]
MLLLRLLLDSYHLFVLVCELAQFGTHLVDGAVVLVCVSLHLPAHFFRPLFERGQVALGCLQNFFPVTRGQSVPYVIAQAHVFLRCLRFQFCF